MQLRATRLTAIAHAARKAAAFNPSSLFSAGEQGWWFDPSNLSTLFQDAAGTTPVTAVEQPVGLQLDLSGRGNHRFQSTSANRPVVSARVNLLTKTEDFSDAVWTKGGATVTANAAVAPDGTLTADKLVETAITGGHQAYATASGTIAGTVTFSVCAKAAERSWLFLADNGGGVYFDLANGVVGTASGSRTGTITAADNGFYVCSVTATWVSTNPIYIAIASNNGTFSFAGTAGSGIFIWGADLRPTNQGVGLPAYQRVNTSTDYDTTGFPIYIKPNGSNQFMVTNSINFSATDKMTVWQGVRKLSSSTFQIIAETGTDSYSVAGSFGIFPTGPVTRTESYGTFLRGSNVGYAGFGPYVAPITNVLQLSYDISASSITGEIAARINGATVGYQTTGGSAGTGNFGNLPAYFYARAGTTFFFNGNDYGSIARGAASTAAQITNGETYINSKTKAY